MPDEMEVIQQWRPGRAEERGVLRQGGDGGYADTVRVAWLRR